MAEVGRQSQFVYFSVLYSLCIFVCLDKSQAAAVTIFRRAELSLSYARCVCHNALRNVYLILVVSVFVMLQTYCFWDECCVRCKLWPLILYFSLWKNCGYDEVVFSVRNCANDDMVVFCVDGYFLCCWVSSCVVVMWTLIWRSSLLCVVCESEGHFTIVILYRLFVFHFVTLY
jgi:hypothetical protein